MNRRALGIAIVVAILGMFLMLLYQQRFEQEASGGDKIPVLQLTKQLDRGANITDDALTVRRIPVAYLEERAVKENEKQKVLGLPMANVVRAQQTLMWTDVVSSQEEQKDVSQLVLPGYRAVTIRVSRDDSSVALVQPGDYVDVIGVIGATQFAEQKTAAVLLQKVLVLASGDSTSARKDEKSQQQTRDVESITLSLTLPEAQVLALASEKGRLSVAVRPPADSQTSQGTPDIKTDDIIRVAKEQPRNNGGVRPSGPIDIGPAKPQQ